MVTWSKVVSITLAGQIDQTDHDLDDLDPNLPPRDAVQDLYGTDPTQEICP